MQRRPRQFAGAFGGIQERRLLLGWEIEALAPLIPGAVVIRSVGVSDAIEREEDRRRGQTAIAIGDDLLVTSDAGITGKPAQLIVGLPGAVIIEENLCGKMHS